MQKKEIITFRPEPVRVITNENKIGYFMDENHALVLKVLRKKPMTISEITEAFKQQGVKKSYKSVYRYVSKLAKEKLVAKAGKQIISVSEGELQTETIYARTATTFITKLQEVVQEGIIIPAFDVVRMILSQFFNNTQGSDLDFTRLAGNLEYEKNQLFIRLLRDADDEIIDAYNKLDWKETNKVHEFVGWLAICLSRDIPKEIAKAFVEE